MNSRLILFLYVAFMLIFGYYAIFNLSHTYAPNEASNAFQAAIYIVCLIFATFWFSAIYPTMRKKEMIENLNQYAPGMKIILSTEENFRLACRVNVMTNVIEVNYHRMMMYPHHCRVFMILWCHHRAIQHDLNQLRPEELRKDALGVVLDSDLYAFQDYIGLGLSHEVLSRYFFRDQMMLGEFKVERYKFLRELINGVKAGEHGSSVAQ